jgi:hypothetical protein
LLSREWGIGHEMPCPHSASKFAGTIRDASRVTGDGAEMRTVHRNKEHIPMNSLQAAEIQSRTALATHGAIDPFQKYADAVAPQTIFGTLLRFTKGDYLAGEDGKAIAEGTVFTADVDELMDGWVKWSDGRPVEHIMVRVAEGQELPKRADLGDDDSTRWERDSSGEPRDPWQRTNYLPMMDEAGELFTFATSSRGGLVAIAGLCRTYGRFRPRHQDVHPMIAVEVHSYQHHKREYGRIKVPRFTLISWAPKAKFNEALVAAGFALAGEPPEAEDEAQADRLNDEIPF